MCNLIGEKVGYLLNRICNIKGLLYLIGDNLSPIEETTERHILDKHGWREEITTFNRKFVIKVTASNPKKVDRKTVLYTTKSCNLNAFYLIHIDETRKIDACENIKLSVDENDVVSFNLIDTLQEKNFQFKIPETPPRLSRLDKVYMEEYFTVTSFGLKSYLPARGIAFDGTGEGYAYYFWPYYFSIHGVGINYLLIHSYAIRPIELKVNHFLESLEKKEEVSLKQIEDLLLDICNGNEFAIQTDNMSVRVYRHYASGVTIEAFGKSYRRSLLPGDSKHRTGYAEEEWFNTMEKLERTYASFLSKLIASKTTEEVQMVVDTFFPDTYAN